MDREKTIRVFYILNSVTCCLNIAAYTATAVSVLTGTRNLFLLLIIGLLTLSNLCCILSDVFERRSGEQIDPLLYLMTIMTAIYDYTFNLAHWLYFYKYWRSAFKAQRLVLHRQNCLEPCTKYINILMMVLMIFI